MSRIAVAYAPAGPKTHPGFRHPAAFNSLLFVSAEMGASGARISTTPFPWAKLKTTHTALVNCEAFIQDDMGFTAAGPPGDPGAPDRFALGVLANADALSIRASAHPLAAGLSGRIRPRDSLTSVNNIT